MLFCGTRPPQKMPNKLRSEVRRSVRRMTFPFILVQITKINSFGYHPIRISALFGPSNESVMNKTTLGRSIEYVRVSNNKVNKKQLKQK